MVSGTGLDPGVDSRASFSGVFGAQFEVSGSQPLLDSLLGGSGVLIFRRWGDVDDAAVGTIDSHVFVWASLDPWSRTDAANPLGLIPVKVESLSSGHSGGRIVPTNCQSKSNLRQDGKDNRRLSERVCLNAPTGTDEDATSVRKAVESSERLSSKLLGGPSGPLALSTLKPKY